MISLFQGRCSAILSRASNLVSSSPSCGYFRSSREASFRLKLEFLLRRSRVQCYSTKKVVGASSRRKSDPKKLTMEKDEFFVVRKGDLVAVYRSLSDCQAQVGTSICDPPVSVYKGCSMPKDTENFLRSQGLKDALYSIRASDLTDDLFGTLVACPLQPSPKADEAPAKKKLKKDLRSDYEPKLKSCTLEFDGASKGNPGKAGAGAILRNDDGSVICKLSEGVGIATNNFAEYKGAILGMRYAAEKGYTNILVKGDSKLVCMQIQDLWKVKSDNLLELYNEAKELKSRFRSFKIMHVLRDLNSDADAQANVGAQLAEGEVQEDFD